MTKTGNDYLTGILTFLPLFLSSRLRLSFYVPNNGPPVCSLRSILANVISLFGEPKN